MTTDTTTPERHAQGLSFRKGCDDGYSITLLDPATFETWLRELAARDARVRGVDLTRDLIASCWDEYKGGVNFRSGEQRISGNFVDRPTMWEYEIDPDSIPATPWRCYRLYSADGRPIEGYYSLEGGKFMREGAGPSAVTFEAWVIQSAVATFNRADFGPVTLRALTAPETNPAP